jgi:L-rhamnose mutarotase
MKHPILLYLFTLLFLTACAPKQVQSPAILEIIDSDYRFSTDILLNFSKENNIDKSSLYQWQNHWLVYTDSKAAEALKTRLENKFPRLTIKFYEKAFYNFNRQKQCHDRPADEWVNIIMTANLVTDTIKQNEYMEYHRTQFEKWPEISKGFCNAGFQQLLVFRNGRQLMLVISIPKGESLDKLNPKTSENNPRVDEWNKIMSQFQEGIEDAPKGTVWVMFQSLR